MNNSENNTIGLRVRELRKRKGLNQQELADLLGKSLRTIQKYENGEISISIAMINSLARVLDTTSTYLLGYKQDKAEISCMSDIMAFLFSLEKVVGLKFDIDVKRPPHFDGWECSIKFNGKEHANELNADLCLFLEDWRDSRNDFFTYMCDKGKYEDWKDQTLAYYAASSVESEELEELDFETRIKKKEEYVNSLYGNSDNTQK